MYIGTAYCAWLVNYCCGASEQQHNQDLRRIYRRDFITFYQNALHLTRVHCATFCQSALRHELQEDVWPSSRVDFMFCSDLAVKRCEEDRALLFVDALGKHPLCHRMCKVTKETSGANNIMRNAIDSTSITFRWTSISSRQSVFSTSTIAKKTEENGTQSRKSDYLV